MTGSFFSNGVHNQLDGCLDDTTHHYFLRVQYEDTDAGAIVYHAQYLAFAERARSAWLRCLGIDQSLLLVSDGAGFVVRHVEVDFKQAAKLGSALQITSSMIKIRGASIKLKQIITNMRLRHIVAQVVVDIGFVILKESDCVRVCRIPKDIRVKLENGMSG